MNCNELLDISSTIGYMLLKYGAEIYRVEDTIYRICKAYGFENTEMKNHVEVYAIPASLLITIEDNDGITYTTSKRISNRLTDFDKVDALNNLSRRICSLKPEHEETIQQIEQIKSRKTYPYSIRVISFVIVGFTFALFFGGKIPDAIIGGITGAIIKILLSYLSKFKPSLFLESVASAMSASIIAIIALKCGFITDIEYAIIGPLMNLVPGITLTNCMRDFIAGDFNAGIYTMTEALIVAVGMAVGAASIIALFGELL